MSTKQAVKKQVAKRLGVKHISQATVDQLRNVDLATDRQEEQVIKELERRGRDAIRQRCGKLPKTFCELEAFESENDLERLYIDCQLAFKLPFPSFSDYRRQTGDNEERTSR